MQSVPAKSQDWGTVIPGKMETYVFRDEKSYYEDYQKSYFAVTHKKGGWDCMRHYEILANGCVPYFHDIVFCPDNTMVDFPKKECREANDIVHSGILDDKYQDLANRLLRATKDKLTTESVFNKMLSHLNE